MIFYKTKKTFGAIIKFSRYFSLTSRKNFKVVVCGASGGIGQPLGLLLKQNPLVSQLTLYDTAKINPGVAVDLSHINSKCCVDCFGCPEQLFYALFGAHVVVITAGIGRKPGMSRDDLFNTNAGIIFDLSVAIARFAPCACVAIVTNPVNSMVPVCSEVMSRCNVYDPTKIMGVTTLDLVRAATFVANANCTDPVCQYVPVVGGHAGTTIIPLLSQSSPGIYLSETVRDRLTRRIQDAGTEVVEAKAGGGSATLSMAFAAARFTDAILRGLAGQKNVVDTAYVRSTCTEAAYFATPLVFGCAGVQQNLGIPSGLTTSETCSIQKAIDILKKDIQKGVEFGACR